MTGLPGQYCQDRVPEWKRQNKIVSTVLSRTFRAGQPEQDGWDRTARKRKAELDSLNGTNKMGQEDDGMQIRNATDCQGRTAST